MGHVRSSFLIVLFCVVLSSILCPAPSLEAAETPLGFIPGEASVVWRFEAPERITRKFDALLAPLQPKPKQAGAVDAEVLFDLSLPSIERIIQAATKADQKQDWWWFGSNLMEDPLSGYAIPAADPDALAKDLIEAEKKHRSENADNRNKKDKEFVTIVHEKWVIHAYQEMIDRIRECIAGKRKSIVGRMDAEAKLVFDRGDIGVFIDVLQLAKEFGDDLQEVVKSFVEGYVGAYAATINGPEGLKKFLSAVPGQLIAAITQGIRDVDGFTASLTLDEEEIRFEDYISVKPDTPTAAFLRANPASKMEPLAALPPSCAIYFAFHGNQKALTSWMTQYIKAGAEGTDPGFTPSHAEIRRGYEELEYGTFAAAFPVWPIEQGPLRMLSITEVNDAQRARDLGLKWLDLPPCVPGMDEHPKTKMTLGVEKFGRHPADVCTTTSGFSVLPFPVQGKEFDKLLFGPDGHVTRTVYLKDRIVEATGGTKVAMAAAVRRAADAALDGIQPNDDEPLFSKTRRKLGEKANLIVMVDLGGLYASYLQAAVQMAAQMGQIAQPAEGAEEPKADADDAENVPQVGLAQPELEEISSQIESLKSSTSLVGISLALEPQASRLRVVIPAKTIQGLGTLVVGGPEAPEDADADEDAVMEGDEEDGEETTEAEPESKPAAVPEEKIVGDRTWKGKVREGKTLTPIAGADVLLKLSTTGDETTNETKLLREITVKTGEDGTFEFTIKEDEANKRTLYVEFTIRSREHVEFYGGYGYGMLLKNEKMNERPFFEDMRLPRGRAVEGTVKTPEGEPAAGVKVIVCTSPNFTNRGARVRFLDTRTDDKGHFRLVIFPQARAILWLLPQDYVIQTQPIRQNQEGDLGTYVLNPGPKISGKLLDAEGNPVAGVYVEADFAFRPQPQEGKVPLIPDWIGDQNHRATVTNEDGSFEFRPLRPGKYTITPSEKGWDPSTREGAVDPPRRPLPAVFLEAEVTIKRGEKPAPLEIRAIPHVVLEIQSRSSKGPRRGGPDLNLFGTRDGSSWHTDCEPSAQGTYRILVPKGMEDAQLSCITNEHTAVRFRMKKGAPLMEGHSFSLGKLTRDRKGMQIISYESPTLVISAKTEGGDRIKDLDPKVTYAEFEGKNVVRHNNVGVQNQGGGKYRTIQALPDRELDITIKKEGFKTAEKKLTLPEGKVEEVEFVLEKE